MRRLIYPLCFFLVAALHAPLAGESDNTEYLVFNEQVYAFNDEKITNEDIARMSLWKEAIGEAVNILPANFAENIPGTNGKCYNGSVYGKCNINFLFFIDEKSWVTGYPGGINLRPNLDKIPHWMKWEPFPKNGFNREERLWIAFHELAHMYDMVRDVSYRLGDNEEPPSTFYGCVGGPNEDFGDTLPMYVMFPEQLKKFPRHYELAKQLIGQEFTEHYRMPNSVRSKLVDPLIGCGKNKPIKNYSVAVVK